MPETLKLELPLGDAIGEGAPNRVIGESNMCKAGCRVLVAGLEWIWSDWDCAESTLLIYAPLGPYSDLAIITVCMTVDH